MIQPYRHAAQGSARAAELFDEINGAVLLEVGKEDLDYMEIKILAHRKKILKGIHALKEETRFAQQDAAMRAFRRAS